MDMRHSALLPSALPLAILIATAASSPAAQQKPLFSFHSNAWLNLHQFVRLAARGVAAEADSSSQDERAQWAKGVEFYAPYAKRDLLFDQ